MPRLGTFYGVGIGPGEPELLTLQARRVLSSVPVVFAPKPSISDEGLALQILLKSLPASELRELIFPMSRDPEVLRPAWNQARDEVLSVLREGKDCAFITLGDPAVYSTYMNLLHALKAAEPSLRVVTVPGVSSFSYGAALLNLSLCDKEERLAVLPCLGEVEALRPDLERFDTVVLMKVGRRFAALRELLRDMGLLPYAHLLLRLGMPGELISSDLEAVDPSQVSYMSLVIVRKPAERGV